MERYGAELARLLERLNVAPGEPGERLLTDLLSAFSQIPYENATKILRCSKSGGAGGRFRMPGELAGDFIESGMGGTCFSLVYLFRHLLDMTGFDCYLVLADRTYGENTHCACMVRSGGALYLADPGYLIFHPLPLSADEPLTYVTAPYSLSIEPAPGGKRFDVYSLLQGGGRKFRYTIKNEEVDEGTFFDCWKRSFDFDMMHYLVVNRMAGKRRIYLRDRFLHITDEGRTTRREIGIHETMEILGAMGMSRKMLEETFSALGKH